MEAAAATMVVIYLLLFGFLKYVEHEVKETSTVKQQVFFDGSDPDTKAVLTPFLRDKGFENVLEDMNGYSSKDGINYSSKDGYDYSAKGAIVETPIIPDVLDRLYMPIVIPFPPPPSPPHKPHVIIVPHVTNVDPPMK